MRGCGQTTEYKFSILEHLRVCVVINQGQFWTSIKRVSVLKRRMVKCNGQCILKSLWIQVQRSSMSVAIVSHSILSIIRYANCYKDSCNDSIKIDNAARNDTDW